MLLTLRQSPYFDDAKVLDALAKAIVAGHKL